MVEAKEEIKFIRSKMPKAQKIRFLKYVIDVLTNPRAYPYYRLNTLSFCNIYRNYFGVDIYRHPKKLQIFTTIPEFLQYKPDTFFDCNNSYAFNDDSQFWFKLNPEGFAKRLRIAKAILKQLQ